jgi:uncharacterized protein
MSAAAAWQERVLAFHCQSEPLLGILTLPEAVRGAAVLIIVGGPQYRAGSHRQFVLLARHLAAAGHPVLRFDYRGMGDSAGALHSFEQVDEDIGAAVNALSTTVGAEHPIVLWGLCDGASAALMYLQATADARVRALCLVNPWLRTAQSQARTQVKHYYRDRLRDPAFWKKLLRGEMAAGALAGFLRSLRAARSRDAAPEAGASLPYPQRMAMAWSRFNGPIALLLSDTDYTAREFEEHSAADSLWRAALAQRPPERVSLAGADHTCSQPSAERALHEATAAFVARVGRAAKAA